MLAAAPVNAVAATLAQLTGSAEHRDDLTQVGKLRRIVESQRQLSGGSAHMGQLNREVIAIDDGVLRRIVTDGDDEDLAYAIGALRPGGHLYCAVRKAKGGPSLARAMTELLGAVDPDALSPREAHEVLYKLKGLL